MCDTEKITNVAQLQLNLTRLCASATPNHWMRSMPPEETRDAAAYSDTTVQHAVATILHCDAAPSLDALATIPEHGARLSDSGRQPARRVDLALRCARLDVRPGGLSTSDYQARRTAQYVDSYHHARPIIVGVCPDIATLPIDSPAHPSTAGFAAAYQHLSTTLTRTRQRFAALDADSRTWIDGTVVTAYHPTIPKEFYLPDLADLYDDAESNTLPRFSQRKLSAVINASAWLDAKQEACDRFDVTNVEATVPHREAARLVSCSQTGAGAWPTRLPDVSVRGSISTSIDCVTQCQRRLGLYLSALSVPLDACEMLGMRVAQHDRLGDAAINTANATHRHNEGLNAIYTAMRCASTATLHTVKPPSLLV